MQPTLCESREHLLESRDPMRVIRNLHIQQRQNRIQNEILKEDGAPSGPPEPPEPQELNLILFTPLQGQQSAVGERN